MNILLALFDLQSINVDVN